MNYIKNERGNSVFYILWLFGLSAVIFVIVVNIAKVYVVKQQADTATQQAAFAGTVVMLKATATGIEKFDEDPVKSLDQKLSDLKTIEEQVKEKADGLIDEGEDVQLAYIQAYNIVLPEKMEKYPLFKKEMEDTFKSAELSGELLSAVQTIITENDANAENVEVVLSETKWRIEVKADATFSTITDGTYLKSFTSDIQQKGAGPPLKYLENISFN